MSLPDSSADCRDHPRVCGEHLEGALAGTRDMGSSPRVRGTLSKRRVSKRGSGIIPACAGNTDTPTNVSVCNGDHPRVCGEHSEDKAIIHQAKGSSPRVRGTRICDGEPPDIGGIIPACAGNTCRDDSAPRRCRDHPRVCGEHQKGDPFAASPAGSSPRVRGTHVGGDVSAVDCGIIPACAGNTIFYYVFSDIGGDHPRVCGEHICRRAWSSTKVGSSPRVRGTL